MRGDNTDRDFFEKVANAFYEDLGVHFKVLESVLHHLSDSSFSHDNVEFDEIAPNVIKAKATDVLNDYLSFVVENVPVEDVKSAYDFLTIVPGQLKTICDTTHPILPIWEREKRNHCFAVRPIYMSNNDYIYSPIIMEEVRKRWIEGFLQFYPPFEIGLERTCTALYAWKNNYEHLFSSEVEVLLKESGCEYAKHDVDLRREDRRGNHPTIDVLGDYDVIGLNTTQKRIFIIECKVLQPIGSVFEHSNQQKRFFTKEKFDEKFQKRIHHKPCAEAEAGDEGVQLGFAHEFGVDVTEAEEQRLVLSGELLGELFLQIVQRVGDLFYRALGVVAAILWVDVAVVQLLNDISPHCPALHFCSSQSRSMWRRDLRVVALCSSVESQSIR